MNTIQAGHFRGLDFAKDLLLDFINHNLGKISTLKAFIVLHIQNMIELTDSRLFLEDSGALS